MNLKNPSEKSLIFTFIIALFSFVLIKTFITFYGFCFNPRATHNTESFDGASQMNIES